MPAALRQQHEDELKKTRKDMIAVIAARQQKMVQFKKVSALLEDELLTSVKAASKKVVTDKEITNIQCPDVIKPPKETKAPEVPAPIKNIFKTRFAIRVIGSAPQRKP